MLLIRLQAQPTSNLRCPYCHQELGPSRRACAQCQTLHHPECLEELGRCTVLGCTGPHLHPRRRRIRLLQTRRPRSALRRAGVRALLASCLIGVAWLLLFNPFGRRHTHGHEGAAIGSLKAIANAQTLYRECDKDQDGTLNYAASLDQLANTGESGQEDLIDSVLAGGAKHGYVFAITSSSEYGWTATARPSVPGTTGDRYFGANMTGLVFFHHERPVRFNQDGSSSDPVLGY
ncbi:MAG: hypothetical protein JKY65_30425 [Planctomycetes bacterium]|nr:hypothetical protein [Planctomycetota bacterium]